MLIICARFHGKRSTSKNVSYLFFPPTQNFIYPLKASPEFRINNYTHSSLLSSLFFLLFLRIWLKIRNEIFEHPRSDVTWAQFQIEFYFCFQFIVLGSLSADSMGTLVISRCWTHVRGIRFHQGKSFKGCFHCLCSFPSLIGTLCRWFRWKSDFYSALLGESRAFVRTFCSYTYKYK